MKQKFEMVKLTDIECLENTRQNSQNLAELMVSIKENGLLNPVVLAPNFRANGRKYLLVAGNRRHDAFYKLGYKEIPAQIRTDVKNQKDLMLINLSENIQRKDTTPFEEGRFMVELIETYKLTRGELSVRLGVGSSYIMLAINAYKRTPPKFRQKIIYASKGRKIPGKIPISLAKKIDSVVTANKLNKSQTTKLYEKAMEGKISELGLDVVGKSLNLGTTIDKAVKTSNNVFYCRLNPRMSKARKAELEKKYKLSISDICIKILQGKIQEKIMDPVEDPTEYRHPILVEKIIESYQKKVQVHE